MRTPLHHHLYDYFFPHPRNNHRPHLFGVTSVAVLVCAILLLEVGYLVQTKYVFFKTDFLAAVLPGALVALTNQDRAALGIAGVTGDPLLDAAAQAAAEDMASKSYFAHVSPSEKTPWQWLDEAGYRYSYAGQNLAVNFSDSKDVETAWMESPMHRANIAKAEYTQVGFGVAHGVYEGKETIFVVEFFATPAAEAAIPSAPPVERTTVAETPSRVLGSQTTAVPVSPSWLGRLLASPLYAVSTIFTALFAIISVLLALAILVRNEKQHPTVIVGGVLLLVFIFGSMLVSSVLAGTVTLTADLQPAAVNAALQN